MNHVRPILESLGLNPKEIELYLLLLQIGTAPASALARRMRIPSSTAQYTCQQLQKKGLIRMIQKSNVYLFSAEPPQRLLTLVDQEQRMLQEKQEMVRKIVTDLEDIMNPGSVLPKIRFFEGRDSIERAYMELVEQLSPGDEILSYLHSMEPHQDKWNLEPVFRKYRDARMKKKITKRTISPYSELGATHQGEDTRYLRTTRFVAPGTLGKDPVEVSFCGNMMYAMGFEKDTIFGYIVESKAIVDIQKCAFELAWKQADIESARLSASKKGAKK